MAQQVLGHCLSRRADGLSRKGLLVHRRRLLSPTSLVPAGLSYLALIPCCRDPVPSPGPSFQHHPRE